MTYENQSFELESFYNEQFENDFLLENKYTKKAPPYIRSYTKFWKLMKLFSNYIQNSCNVLINILRNLNVRDASGDLLEKIAQRYGIAVEKPLTDDGKVDISKYDAILRFAILSNGIQRSSAADRSTFNEILKILPNIRNIDIRDVTNNPNIQNEVPMVVTAEFIGLDPLISESVIQKYLIPDITGVTMVTSYLLLNGIYFGFDLEEEYPEGVTEYKVDGWDKGYWATTNLK